MDQTKLQKYAEMQAMVQKEIETQFPILYSQYANKFGVSDVPVHYHNSSDSPILSPSSVNGFVPLPAIPGGVANLDILDTQVINNPVVQGVLNPPKVFVYPIPIVYGYGVGVHSGFNGGTAPEGTMLAFSNSGSTFQLYVMIEGVWKGVNLPLTA